MDLKVFGFTVIWVMLLSAGLIVGCYYWYNSTEDKTSRAFSIIVPIIAIGSWIYAAINPDADKDADKKGGRRKRKLR